MNISGIRNIIALGIISLLAGCYTMFEHPRMDRAALSNLEQDRFACLDCHAQDEFDIEDSEFYSHANGNLAAFYTREPWYLEAEKTYIGENAGSREDDYYEDEGYTEDDGYTRPAREPEPAPYLPPPGSVRPPVTAPPVVYPVTPPPPPPPKADPPKVEEPKTKERTNSGNNNGSVRNRNSSGNNNGTRNSGSGRGNNSGRER